VRQVCEVTKQIGAGLKLDSIVEENLKSRNINNTTELVPGTKICSTKITLTTMRSIYGCTGIVFGNNSVNFAL
jgi:hypothetical protein